MKWHLFHRWSPWSEPAPVDMSWVVQKNGVTVSETPYVAYRQTRTCSVCNATQRRIV